MQRSTAVSGAGTSDALGVAEPNHAVDADGGGTAPKRSTSPLIRVGAAVAAVLAIATGLLFLKVEHRERELTTFYKRAVARAAQQFEVRLQSHAAIVKSLASVARGTGPASRVRLAARSARARVQELEGAVRVAQSAHGIRAAARDEVRLAPGGTELFADGLQGGIHVAAELFQTMTGTRLTHIPYKGSGPALSDLLGGHVSVYFSSLPPAAGLVREGRLRALAVTGPKRSAALAAVPTISEQGFPGVEATAWYGVLAPAGTPRPVITRLHGELVKILALPDVAQKLNGLGFEIVASTPEAFSAYIRSEIRKWEKVVKASGAKAN